MTLLSRRKHSASADASADTDEAVEEARDGATRKKPRKQTKRARQERRSRWTLPNVGTQILVLMVLVALALTVAVVSLLMRADTLRTTDGGAEKARNAAMTAAQDLSSYDYRTLESDIKTAAGQTTGRLRTDYEKQAQAIIATARQQQVVVNAQALRAGVESAKPDEVVVLVFLNRTSSKASGQPRTPDQLRLQMTMSNVGDRWLVSKIDLL
jgi:Mce-associated membrane protein